VLDRLAASPGESERVVECNALVIRGERRFLVWPQTYMNRSGFSVRCLFERHGFEASDLLVVFDDTALPLGTLRLRGKGGPGGHRGMESVIQNVRTDEVARLRLGVAPATGLPDQEDLSDFVLSDFRNDELEDVDEMIRRAVSACECWLEDGTQLTMNRFNG
jgi:PTH1 family peptidyl-tRNA hydrolase